MTPLEENKSFLEKVRLGGLLCGLHEDSVKALTRNNKEAATVLADVTEVDVLSYVKQNGASPRRKQYHQLQTQPQQNGHRMQGSKSTG